EKDVGLLLLLAHGHQRFRAQALHTVQLPADLRELLFVTAALLGLGAGLAQVRGGPVQLTAQPVRLRLEPLNGRPVLFLLLLAQAPLGRDLGLGALGLLRDSRRDLLGGVLLDLLDTLLRGLLGLTDAGISTGIGC